MEESLREALAAAAVESGFQGTVKAQIRAWLVQQLTAQAAAPPAAGNSATVTAGLELPGVQDKDKPSSAALGGMSNIEYDSDTCIASVLMLLAHITKRPAIFPYTASVITAEHTVLGRTHEHEVMRSVSALKELHAALAQLFDSPLLRPDLLATTAANRAGPHADGELRTHSACADDCTMVELLCRMALAPGVSGRLLALARGSLEPGTMGAGASATLSATLLGIEDKYRAVASQSVSANTALTARLAELERESNEKVVAQVKQQVEMLRATELAAVRAEERRRYDAALAEAAAQAEKERRQNAAESAAALEEERDALRRARDDVTRSGLELRSRLLAELDSASRREAAASRAAALEQKSLAAERARWEENERMLLARMRDAEERAKHADASARLTFERWKTEYLVDLESRSAALARDARLLQDERIAFEEQRRVHHTAVSSFPQQSAEVARLRSDLSAITAALSEARSQIAQSEAAVQQAQRVAEREAAERYEAQQSLAAAVAATATAKAELAAARVQADTSRVEWSAAVRMLRDKLAASVAKLQKQEASHTAAEQSWQAAAAQAVEAEREAWMRSSREWTNHVSTLQEKVQRLEQQVASEQARADEAAARNKTLAASLAEVQARLQAAALNSSAPSAGSASMANMGASLRSPVVAVRTGGGRSLMRLSATAPVLASAVPSASASASGAAMHASLCAIPALLGAPPSLTSQRAPHLVPHVQVVQPGMSPRYVEQQQHPGLQVHGLSTAACLSADNQDAGQLGRHTYTVQLAPYSQAPQQQQSQLPSPPQVPQYVQLSPVAPSSELATSSAEAGTMHDAGLCAPVPVQIAARMSAAQPESTALQHSDVSALATAVMTAAAPPIAPASMLVAPSSTSNREVQREVTPISDSTLGAPAVQIVAQVDAPQPARALTPLQDSADEQHAVVGAPIGAPIDGAAQSNVRAPSPTTGGAADRLPTSMATEKFEQRTMTAPPPTPSHIEVVPPPPVSPPSADSAAHTPSLPASRLPAAAPLSAAVYALPTRLEDDDSVAEYASDFDASQTANSVQAGGENGASVELSGGDDDWY